MTHFKNILEFRKACQNGDLISLKNILNNFDLTENNLRMGIKTAQINGHLDVIKFLISTGHVCDLRDITHMLCYYVMFNSSTSSENLSEECIKQVEILLYFLRTGLYNYEDELESGSIKEFTIKAIIQYISKIHIEKQKVYLLNFHQDILCVIREYL